MLRSIALLLLLCQVTEAQENLGVQDLFESMPTPKYVAETPAAAEKRPPSFRTNHSACRSARRLAAKANHHLNDDTLIISIKVFGVSTLPFPSTQPVVKPAAIFRGTHQ